MHLRLQKDLEILSEKGEAEKSVCFIKKIPFIHTE